MNKRKLFCLGLVLIFSVGVYAMDTEPQEKANTTTKDPESFEEMWARWKEGRLNTEEEQAFQKDFQESISFAFKVNNATPAQVNLKKKLLGYTQHCKKDRLEKRSYNAVYIYINCYKKSSSWFGLI